MPAPVRPTGSASLPTYHTAADVLEKKNGSGLRLAGWTVARSFLIIPPFLAVGVEPKKAVAGGAIASVMISVFTLMRIYNAGFEQELAARRQRARLRMKSTRTSLPSRRSL